MSTRLRCRLQDSKGVSFFTFLLHKEIIISCRVNKKSDVHAITMCSLFCPPNKYMKLNLDGALNKHGEGGGGQVLVDEFGLGRAIYIVPFAHG